MQRKKTEISLKGRFFGYNPEKMQELSDIIRERYGSQVAISRPNPTDQGDFVVLFTVYGDAEDEM